MARSFDDTTPDRFIASTGDFTFPITIAGWVKWTDDTNRFQEPFQLSDGVQQYFLIQLDLDGPLAYWFRWRVKTGGKLNDMPMGTGLNMSINTWYHVACTASAYNGDATGYVNGTAYKFTDSLRNKAISGSINYVEVGGNDTSGRNFHGELAHFGVWNAVLNDDEVDSLVAGFSPLNIRRANLMNYWPFNGQTVEPDIVGDVDVSVASGSPGIVEEPWQHPRIVAP